MQYHQFQATLQQLDPSEVSVPVRALWQDAQGHWDRAHELVQDDPSPAGAWVHAYLHRKEGDEGNAAYWYRRAGQSFFDGSLDQEWRHIAEALLK